MLPWLHQRNFFDVDEKKEDMYSNILKYKTLELT
jgi:hypothetical protein